jgi:thiol-disulfide isomerase/thioredoxin
MAISAQKRLTECLLAGFAMLMLSPEQAAAKANNHARDALEAAVDAAELAPSDDQAKPDPDCPDIGSGMSESERHAIDDPFGQAFTGARNGKVKLVVFVDYGCPACREAQPVLDRLVKEYPDLEVVYRIVDNEAGSTGATEVSLAVARSNSDWQAFHHALHTEASVSDEAIGRALDAVHLKKSCYLPSDTANVDISVLDEFRRNQEFISERKLGSFPSWVIGQGPVHGGIEYETLKAAVARAKASAR